MPEAVRPPITAADSEEPKSCLSCSTVIAFQNKR